VSVCSTASAVLTCSRSSSTGNVRSMTRSAWIFSPTRKSRQLAHRV
jgi:hypothetical protein